MPGRTLIGIPHRTTILGAIFLAVLGVYRVAFLPERAPDRGEARESVLARDPQDVVAIRVEADSGSVVGERSADGWQVSGTRSDHWSARVLDDLVTALCTLPVLDRIESPGPAGDYGLAEPQAHLRVRTRNAVHDVEVGALSPAGTRVYVRLDGAREVMVVGSMLRSEIDKLLHPR